MSKSILSGGAPFSFLTLTFLAWACSIPDSGQPSSAIFSDSSGVQLVHNPDSTLRFTELKEDLRIGSIHGSDEYLFHEVRSVGVHRDGEILVGQSGSSTLRVYSTDGAFLREFGGRGHGPGEFDPLLQSWVHGDSVLVLGAGGGPMRLSLFHFDGTFHDSWPQYSPDRFRVTPLGKSGSTWLASVRHPVDPSALVPGGIWVDTTWVHPFSPGTGILSTEIVGSPGQALILGSRGEASAGPLFDPWPRIAADTLGFIFRTQGEEYRIEVFDLGGSLVRMVTRSHSSRAISQEWLEDFEARVRAHYRSLGGGSGRDEEMERIIENRAGLIRVDHLPPTGRLLVGSEGTFWVERRDLDESPGLREFERSFGRVGDDPRPTTWDVFKASGEYSTSVQLPEAFQLHVVSENTALGVLRDELDVEYVVRFVFD